MPSAKEPLSALFKKIANAIRAKDGTSEATDKIFPEDYPDRIAAIQTGIDTSDADASPSDIVSGKTAYVDGEKITGTLATASSGSTLPTQSGSTTVAASGSNLSVTTTIGNSTLLQGGSQIKMEVPLSDFGTATTGDVLSGKTFTSSGGFKQSGTIVSRSSSSLSVSGETVTVPAGYYPSQTTKSVSTATQATPTISRSGTIVTASVTQNAGYVPGGTKSSSITLPSAGSITGGTLGTTGGANWGTADPNRGSGTVSITGLSQTAGFTDGLSNGSISVTVPANRLLKGRTITPTTSEQLVGNAEDILYTAIKVAGDANLVASNIKSGVSIFGVTGSYSGGSSLPMLFNVFPVITIPSAYAMRVDFSSNSNVNSSKKIIFAYMWLKDSSNSYHILGFTQLDYMWKLGSVSVYGELSSRAAASSIGVEAMTITSVDWYNSSTLNLMFSGSLYNVSSSFTVTNAIQFIQ